MCLVTTGLLVVVVVGFLAPLAQAADVQVVFVAGQSNCQGIADKLHLFELIDEGGELRAMDLTTIATLMVAKMSVCESNPNDLSQVH